MSGKPSGEKSRAIEPVLQSAIDHWTRTDPDDRLAHLVRDVAGGLKRSLQLRLSEHGVQFGHWAFLRVLWSRDGLSQRELSEQTGLTESTTHTALNRMECLGLIRRCHIDGNRRRMHVFLTDAGRVLEHTLVPLAVEVNDIAVAGLSAGQVEMLRSVLLRLLSNLAKDELESAREGRRITSTRTQAKVGES